MPELMKVIKAEQAAEILKEHGYSSANAVKIKMGLEQGVFPFGQAIHMGKRTVYDIYENLLLRWIKERESE